MKFLFDLLPILLFFVVFKVGEANRAAAAESATHWFGWMVAGGTVTAAQAPILWATLVAIAATAAQVGWQLARGRKVDRMLWIGLAVVVVFGGATIWFQNETFIKWKPTVLYWTFGAVLVVARLGFRRNLVQSLMQSQIALPDPVWRRLDLAWIGFFGFMGLANLYVAYRYPTDTWVSFKLFGLLGLTFAFVIAQALWLSRHVTEDKEPLSDARRP